MSAWRKNSLSLGFISLPIWIASNCTGRSDELNWLLHFKVQRRRKFLKAFSEATMPQGRYLFLTAFINHLPVHHNRHIARDVLCIAFYTGVLWWSIGSTKWLLLQAIVIHPPEVPIVSHHAFPREFKYFWQNVSDCRDRDHDFKYAKATYLDVSNRKDLPVETTY